MRRFAALISVCHICFFNAIEAVFSQTEIQNAIIHQLCNSNKYVFYKNLKALMTDLKAVYAAVDEQAASDKRLLRL